MEQYLTGLINEVDKNGNKVEYHTKINLATGLEGTKLTGIDRTAYGVHDVLVGQFDISKQQWDGMNEAQRKAAIKHATDSRLAIENAMMPQEISALPTFASGSEQIHAMVGHLTGTKYNSATGTWENVIRDDANGEVDRAIVDYTTSTYLKALTVRDLIGMKTDTWNGIVARYSYDYEDSVEGQAEIAAQHFENIADEAERKKAKDTFVLEHVHARLRGDLKTRIQKLAQGNMNVDMMKEKIYDALQIGQEREKYWNSRRKGNGKGVTDRDPRDSSHVNMDDPDNPFEPSDNE